MYLWNHRFSKIPPKNLIDFCPARFIQHKFKYLFYKNLLAQKSIKWFHKRHSQIIWPVQGWINFRLFEHIFASIITVCNAVFLASRFLLPPPQSPRCSSDYSRLARDWTAAPWARTTKNVKKPLGEKGQTFRKSKCYIDPKSYFWFSKRLSFFPWASTRVQYV